MNEIAIVGLYGFVVLIAMWIGSGFGKFDKLIEPSWRRIFLLIFTIPIFALLLMFIKDVQTT